MNDMATIKQTPQQFHDEAIAAIKSTRSLGELAAAHDRYLAGEEYLHAGPEAVAELKAAYRDRLAWLWGIGG